MPNFFKSLFSSSEDKRKDVKLQKEVIRSEEHKEFSTPYDTKRKLSISRSGKMKQNLKERGKLGNDLFGEIPQKVEKTKIEYHVNKNLFETIEKMDVNESNEPINQEDKIVNLKLEDFPQKVENTEVEHHVDKNLFETIEKIDVNESNELINQEDNIVNLKLEDFPQKVENTEVEHHVDKNIFEAIEKMDSLEVESESNNENELTHQVKVNNLELIYEDDDVDSELVKFEEDIDFITKKYTETDF